MLVIGERINASASSLPKLLLPGMAGISQNWRKPRLMPELIILMLMSVREIRASMSRRQIWNGR